MNADDAFNRLMRENNLAIPVAKVADFVSVASQQRTAAASAAVKVGRVYDGEAEYIPSDSDIENNGLSSHPTETELTAVADVDTAIGNDVDSLLEASEEGARIIGRDIDEEFVAPSPVPSAPPRTPPGRRSNTALLAGAKRVKRFAQLPIVGFENFENTAMELTVNLTAADPERPSLLLTSSSRGEGRTEMAIRLALAMARRIGSRVLLADFDVKSPKIASRLGLAVKYFSLSDVLRGTCPLDEALTASDEDNLYVLPCRSSDRAGDDIFDSRQAGTILSSIHAAFDFAVIDAGPIEHNEAQMLCRLTGAVAIVGYRGLTTAGRMARTSEMAEMHGGKVAGMLLAGM